jgi:hypothetical protein
MSSIIGPHFGNSKGKASGVWSLRKQYNERQQDLWPRAAPIATYIGTTVYVAPNTTPFNTYTFSGVNLGTGPNKFIMAIYVQANSTNTGNLLSTATIGGNSASFYKSNPGAVAQWEEASGLFLQNSSLTTGDVTLTFSSNLNTFGGTARALIAISVYSVETYSSLTFHTSSIAGTAGTTAFAMNSAAVPALGIAAAVHKTAIAGSYGSLTTDYNVSSGAADPTNVLRYVSASGPLAASNTVSLPSTTYAATIGFTLTN